jgi:hypothetical protein
MTRGRHYDKTTETVATRGHSTASINNHSTLAMLR